MMNKKLGFAVLALTAIVAVSFSQENGGISSLLQPVAVEGPLRLVYVPAASLAQQQMEESGPASVYTAANANANPALAYQQRLATAYSSAAPIRFAYAPANSVAAPYQGRANYIRYVPVETANGIQEVAEIVPQQQYAQQQQYAVAPSVAAAAKSGPSKAALLSTKAKEITQLRNALNSAVERERKYEEEVERYKDITMKAAKEQSLAATDLVKAKKMKNWAALEKTAAARLTHVQQMAENRAAKQNALIDKLLPKVRAEISRRRVLERRLTRAALMARNSAQMENMERMKLMNDLQIEQSYENAAHVAALAAEKMTQRSIQMTKQAKEDRVTAREDIKQARASVLGARQSAEKTLAAIRNAMKNGQGKAVSAQTQEENFAREARMKTKEMSSKKKDAKALREEATRLDRQAKTLALEAVQRKQVVPSFMAKAHAAAAAAANDRAVLKSNLQNSLPLSLSVENGEQLAQVSSNKGGGEVRQLAKAESEYAQSAALLHRVQHVTAAEEWKAARDAKLAELKLQTAKKRLSHAATTKAKYVKKIKTLTSVLADAKTELGELETEAKDIAADEE